MSNQIQILNQNQKKNNCTCSENLIFYTREYESLKLEAEHFKNYELKYFYQDFLNFGVSHFIGILPFECPNIKEKKILLVGPKKKNGNFNDEEIESDILKFSYLSVFSGYPESFDRIKVADEPNWKIKDLSNQKLGIYFLSIIYGVVLENLFKKDFRKSYIPQEEELLSRVRGRIKQKEYLNNWWKGKRLNIPCRWEEFTEDNLENRILKYALKKLEFLKNDSLWHNKILLQNFKIPRWKFQDVSDIEIFIPSIFNSLKLDKVSKYYKDASYVAKQIIFGSEDIKTEKGIPPILFDTNVLFEKVSQKICEIAGAEAGWDVSKNKGGDIFEKNEEKFIPDVVLKKGDEVVVADAKYKLIIEAMAEKPEEVLFNPDTKDIYQMYFYMRNLGAKKGVFFVPVWEEQKKEISRKFNISPLDNKEEAKIYIFPINLGSDDLNKEIEGKIDKFKELL